MNDKFMRSKSFAVFQLIIFSIIGLFVFFVPVTIAGKNTILFDHATIYLVKQQYHLSVTLLFLLMIYGVFKPFVTGSWKTSLTNKIFSFIKILGLIFAIMYVFNLAPAVLMEKDMLPFLFEKLALSVGMIIPIGSLALAFLIGFGLLEMVGVLMQPVMRPIWRTPGASAIDAVASFVGSYSIGLLITNRVYLQKHYSTREAVIIATGFSTVSAAFMIIVAKTLNLMGFWNFFFWSTLVITFVITAISARIYPISKMDDQDKNPEPDYAGGKKLSRAISVGVETARKADKFHRIIWSNFRDGLEMAAVVAPSILAVGLIGLVLAKYTPLFDFLGLFVLPFTWITGMAEPLLAAKGITVGLAEMFLPSLLLHNADLLVRYVAGVVSISSVLFFSGMIPCVLATKIPLSLGKMVLIWFERTVLGIILAAILGHVAIYFNWIA